jgi:hypothetical protein
LDKAPFRKALPAVLKAYRVYEEWMSAGAKPEDMPSFDAVEEAG